MILTLISWNQVKIHYISTKELLRPLETYLPQAPTSRDVTPRASPKKLFPDDTSFDSMASGLGSSLSVETNSYEPPSPTLTATSTATTIEEHNFTPWRHKSNAPTGGDEMDWTPTKPRFNPNPPSLLPGRLTSLSPTKPSHSYYTRSSNTDPSYSHAYSPAFRSGPDANPFRRRVPVAPKAPAAKLNDPWKRPAWQPDPLLREKNLFEEDKERNASLGAGLHGKGVPRTVEREAQLFAPPQFKFEAEAYGSRRESTGLEETFNNLFSK